MIAATQALEIMPFQLQLFSAAEPPAGEPAPTAGDRPAPVAGPAARPVGERARQAARKRRQIAEAGQGLAELLNGEQAALAPRLRAALDGRLGALTLTDNRSTIVSARERGGKLDVRIQRCFAAAPDQTIAAVAEFLQAAKGSPTRRRALAEIREYFGRYRPARPLVRRPRRIILRPVGHTLDLRVVRDEINRLYFGGELDVHVTWGRAPSRRRKRKKNVSVRLGTYSDRDRLVRIHRCLDRPAIPRYVVASVVYHEMLHAAVPPVMKNGRRRIHTPEFRRRERQFPDYQRAERWLGRNLGRLL